MEILSVYQSGGGGAGSSNGGGGSSSDHDYGCSVPSSDPFSPSTSALPRSLPSRPTFVTPGSESSRTPSSRSSVSVKSKAGLCFHYPLNVISLPTYNLFLFFTSLFLINPVGPNFPMVLISLIFFSYSFPLSPTIYTPFICSLGRSISPNFPPTM